MHFLDHGAKFCCFPFNVNTYASHLKIHSRSYFGVFLDHSMCDTCLFMAVEGRSSWCTLRLIVPQPRISFSAWHGVALPWLALGLSATFPSPLCFSLLCTGLSFGIGSLCQNRFWLKALEKYSPPLLGKRIFSFRLPCSSTSVHHRVNVSSASSFILSEYAQTSQVASSMKLMMYRDPPKNFSSIGPHRSIYISFGGSRTFW